MTFRKPSPRWALWVFAAALLLKSAMPFLATASAQWQGKALVEVCTVYGVSLVPLAGDPQQEPADHASGHGADHCALTALAVLAPSGTALPSHIVAAAHGADVPRGFTPSPLPDASADWVVQLHHGPPARS